MHRTRVSPACSGAALQGPFPFLCAGSTAGSSCSAVADPWMSPAGLPPAASRAAGALVHGREPEPEVPSQLSTAGAQHPSALCTEPTGPALWPQVQKVEAAPRGCRCISGRAWPWAELMPMPAWASLGPDKVTRGCAALDV